LGAAKLFLLHQSKETRAREGFLPQAEKILKRSPFGHIAIEPCASLELSVTGNCRLKTLASARTALPATADKHVTVGE
jgi:hypothetical protein